MDKMSFHLVFPQMVFMLEAKNERFTAAGSRCCQNLKYENFTSSFGRLRQNIASKSVLHDYFSAFIQSDQMFSGIAVAIDLIG